MKCRLKKEEELDKREGREGGRGRERMLRSDTSVFKHSRTKPTHKNILARGADVVSGVTEKMKRAGVKKTEQHGPRGRRGDGEEDEEEEDEEEDVRRRTHDEDESEEEDGVEDKRKKKKKKNNKKKKVMKKMTETEMKRNADKGKGAAEQQTEKKDGQGDDEEEDVVAEMRAEILSVFRKLESMEKEAAAWYARVLQIVATSLYFPAPDECVI